MRLSTITTFLFLLITLTTVGCRGSNNGGGDGTEPNTNNAPVSFDQEFPVPVGTSQFFLNATDADNDTLTYEVVDQPAHGNVVPSENGGEVSYTTEAGFTGNDFFTWRAKDATDYSNVATASIIVGGGSAPFAFGSGTQTENPFEILLNAAGTGDAQTPYAQIWVRWYVDGAWTEWTLDKTHIHNFGSLGDNDGLFPVVIEVRDSDLMPDTFAFEVLVTDDPGGSSGEGSLVAETNEGSTDAEDELLSVFPMSDGTFYVAMKHEGLSPTLRRYNQDGSIDPNFNVEIQPGTEPTSVVAYPGFEGTNGKVVVAMLHNNVYDIIFGEGQPSEVSFDGTGTPDRDIVIAQYSDTGHFGQAIHAGGPGWDSVRDMHIRADGSIFLAIDFRRDLYLDWEHFSIPSATNTNMVVALLGPDFRLDWAWEATGEEDDYIRAISSKGNYVHITGILGGPTRIPDGGSIYGPNSPTPFVASIDAQTGMVVSVALGYGGNDVVSSYGGFCLATGVETATELSPFGVMTSQIQGPPGSSIDVAANGDYVVIGTVAGKASGIDNGGMAWESEYSFGQTDMFAIKANEVGSILWNVQLGGTGLDLGRFATITSDGDVFLFGTYNGPFYETHPDDGGLPLFQDEDQLFYDGDDFCGVGYDFI
ncbi:Ig-like domain-containing protein [archaeon]|nr:Ig-like domain-containing protein [archaeon]